MVVIVPQGNFFLNYQFLIVIIIIVILQLRERRIKPWSIFILPLFMVFITAPVIYPYMFSSSLNFIILWGGYIIGTALGIIIGRFMNVKSDETDERIILKGSYVAVGLWIIIILIKIYGENILNNSGLIKLDLVVSLLLMITLGTIISRRAYIYWKYLNHKKTRLRPN